MGITNAFDRTVTHSSDDKPQTGKERLARRGIELWCEVDAVVPSTGSLWKKYSVGHFEMTKECTTATETVWTMTPAISNSGS